MPSVWLIIDERPSHRSQLMGVAEKLGWKTTVKDIRYNAFAAFTNLVLGDRLWHLTPESRALIQGPWPDLVIGAGRRSGPVLLHIKKHAPSTRIVQLMRPDAHVRRFDLVALPAHDSGDRDGPNILRTFGAPHRVTEAKLNMEAARWHNRVSRLPKPRIALLIGGTARGSQFDEADFRMLAAYASAEAERLDGSLLITSSLRTGARGEELVQSILTVPHIFHKYSAGSDNPYLGFLGLADAVIVTGDSVSMCSEACVTGKPVYIFVPPHPVKNGRDFRETLFAEGYAKPHTFALRLDWQPPRLSDASTQVARAIRERLFPDVAEQFSLF